MPKVQVPKNKILETALQLLIREGNEAITIGRLAKELGCSTQPVSRTFGNMERFREEFAMYVLNYFNRKIHLGQDNPLIGFGAVGLRYLQIAFEEPNLIYFIRDNSQKFVSYGGLGAVFDGQKSTELKAALHTFLGISEERAAEFVQISITYTMGLASMIADNTIHICFEEAARRLGELGTIYLVYAGIPEEKARAFCFPDQQPKQE